jgi:hypothetical protein
VYGRADIVDVAGERQLRGTGATTYGVFGFEDDDVASVSCQLHGRGETVGPRADYHSIVEAYRSRNSQRR